MVVIVHVTSLKILIRRDSDNNSVHPERFESTGEERSSEHQTQSYTLG